MLVHLGMSGSLTLSRPMVRRQGRSTRATIMSSSTLDDGSMLVYNDPRRFGLMKLLSRRGARRRSPNSRASGPSHFGQEFNADYLWRVDARADRQRSRTC